MKLLAGWVFVLLSGGMQQASAPPVRMGLWQMTTTSAIQMPDMPQMAEHPQTMQAQVCMTPESWRETLGEGTQNMKTCQHTNDKITATHYSFDIVCPAIGGTGHGEIDFTQDQAHGTVHMEASPGGHHFVVDSTVQSRFVSTACGDVKPGQAQLGR